MLLLKSMLQLALILEDIRSAHNVGSILRSADGFGVSHIYFTGYTPYPKLPQDDRLPHLRDKISRAIHKTALGAENNLAFSVFETTEMAILEARHDGFAIAALEQDTKSLALADYMPPSKLALILGNEITGVSRQTLQACDVILEIAMLGNKESLNVSICAAIGLYALRSNQKQS